MTSRPSTRMLECNSAPPWRPHVALVSGHAGAHPRSGSRPAILLRHLRVPEPAGIRPAGPRAAGERRVRDHDRPRWQRLPASRHAGRPGCDRHHPGGAGKRLLRARLRRQPVAGDRGGARSCERPARHEQQLESRLPAGRWGTSRADRRRAGRDATSGATARRAAARRRAGPVADRLLGPHRHVSQRRFLRQHHAPDAHQARWDL